jgi:2-polyprenyl-3-methyl-5-hydroxy-6-metoxy-1,4-benzoquinol methylase
MDELFHEVYQSEFALNPYDRYYFGLRYLGNKFLLSKLKKYLLHGPRILDIGSGRLLIASTIAANGSRVTAIDLPEVFHDPAVDKRAKRYNIDLVGYRLSQGKHLHLPFKDNSFAVILMTEVFEHLNFSPVYLLQEARRLLAEGGYLILTTPNVHRMENKLKFFLGQNIYGSYRRYLFEQPYNYHWREFDRKELASILAHCEYDLIESYFFNDILINPYSRYLFQDFPQKAKAYLKKMAYDMIFFWPALKKQIVLFARSQT